MKTTPLSVQTKLSARVPKSIKEVGSPRQLELTDRLIFALDAQQLPIFIELVLVSSRQPPTNYKFHR